MLNDHRHHHHHAAAAAAAGDDDHDEVPSDGTEFRDIHELAPRSHPSQGRRRELWEGGSHRSASLSTGSDTANDGFTSVSREFSAMVVSGSAMHNGGSSNHDNHADDGLQNQLARIGEDELEETNPLAIVPDNNPIPSPRRPLPAGDSGAANPADDVPVHLVKKEEVESKISAWQTAEVSKINNRFKRQEVTINGWENEKVEKATAWLKKVEVRFPSHILMKLVIEATEMMQLPHEQRKLEEQRARAMEKMQNDVAKAHHKAAEKRASAEAKRGTKVAKVLELANFMRAVGRAPSKRSFF